MAATVIHWWRTEVYLDIVVLDHVDSCIIEFYPLALTFDQCVVMTESHTAAHMHHDPFDLVSSCFSKRRDSKL